MKSVHAFFTSKVAHEYLLKILILAVSSPPAAAAPPRWLIGGGRGDKRVGLLKHLKIFKRVNTVYAPVVPYFINIKRGCMGINILNTTITYILVQNQLIFRRLRGPTRPLMPRNAIISCGANFAIREIFITKFMVG